MWEKLNDTCQYFFHLRLYHSLGNSKKEKVSMTIREAQNAADELFARAFVRFNWLREVFEVGQEYNNEDYIWGSGRTWEEAIVNARRNYS